MAKIRISELPYLASASAGAVLPVVDNGVTYKTDLQVLETAMIHVLSASLDNRLDFLESFSSSFPQFSSSIDIKIAAATNQQSLGHLVTTSSFNSFTSSYLYDSASFDSRIQNHISSTAYISESYTEFVFSYHSESSSFSSRIDAATNEQYIAGLLLTSSYNIDSESFDSRLNSLETVVDDDSMYLTTESADLRYILSGSVTQTTWENISGKPSDIISSSQQISDLGFVTGAYVEVTTYNQLTQSFNQITQSFYTISGSFDSIDFSGINAITESYLSFTQSYYSDSSSVDGRLIALETEIDDDSMYLATSSFETYTQSIDNRISGLEAQTSSYLTSLDGAITSSQQISELGYAVTSSNIFTGNQTISASLYVSGTTELGGNIVPSIPRGATLGTSERPFADIFIQSASIHIQSDIPGTIDTTLSNVSGNIQISAGGMQLLGSGSFNAASASLNYISGNVYFDILQNSLQNFSSSLDSRILAATNEQNLSGFATTSSLNNLSTSVDSRLDLLESFSSSADGRYVLSGSIAQTTWDNIANKPNDIISSSLQISALGFITGVVDIDNYVTTASYNTDSASFDTRIKNATNEQYILGFATTSSLEIVSASAFGAYTSASSYSGSFYTTINNLSSSFDSRINNFTASANIDTSSFVTTSSFNSFTSSYTTTSASFDSRLDALEGVVDNDSMYATTSSLNSLSASIYLTDVTQSNNILTNSASAWGAFQSASSYSSSFYTTINNLSSSNYQTDVTQSSNITTISASAWGAFQSASSYSSSLATSISASNYTITINSASVSSLSSSIYQTDATQSSNFTSLSSSVDSRLDVVEATASLFIPFSTSVDSRLDNQEAFSSSLSVIANSSTKIVDSAWVGAGSWTGTYTGNGGKVLVTAYASGYVGSTGLYSLSLTRDGIVVDTNSFYFNQASTHMVLPPLNYVGNNETGSHTYAIVLNGGIVQDSGDNGTIVVTETFNTLNAGLISSSAQITALGFVSSSTTINTGSFATTGSNTFIGNEIISGTLNVSGAFTASLQMGYAWAGNSSNIATAFPTASLLSTTSFNSFTSSQYNALSSSISSSLGNISASLSTLQTSLGATSVPFSASSIVNPSAYVLISYSTASYNGGTMDLIAVDTVNNKATSTNYQFVNAGSGTGIAQNGKASSGPGAPNPALSSDIVSGSVRLKVSDTGTFTFKGVIRLF